MIRKNLRWIVLLLVAAMILPYLLRLLPSNIFGSGGETAKPAAATEQSLKSLNLPAFNADSAMVFTEKILSFGPRNMNSVGHEKVKKWLLAELKTLGANVITQDWADKTYDNKSINCSNIIARYGLEQPRRVMFAVHWDTRHIADQDSTDKTKPILGADDSGSGMGILLALAQQIRNMPPDIGVDLVFFDAEDMGEARSDNGWCIGSKHWAGQPHTTDYKPLYGVLLDMAGARNARFTKEATSMQYAPQVMDKVWRVAQFLGYGNFFVNEQTAALIDDHKPVNEVAHIPMIDIINRPADRFFGAYWHTHKDDLSVLDKATMKAVGQTLWHTLHYEAQKAL